MCALKSHELPLAMACVRLGGVEENELRYGGPRATTDRGRCSVHWRWRPAAAQMVWARGGADWECKLHNDPF
jgi:hypothetical protein